MSKFTDVRTSTVAAAATDLLSTQVSDPISCPTNSPPNQLQPTCPPNTSASRTIILHQAAITHDLLRAVVVFSTRSQLVVSYGGKNGDQNIFVALFSVCSCLGRSMLGEASQRLLVARGTPRPAFLALSCVLTTAACVVNSHGSLGALYAGAVAGGFAFGSFWSLMPAVLSEIFGTRFFATIYSSICTAPGLGSLLLATGLTSYVYESKAKDHGTGTTCAGPDCFRGAFFLIGLMSLCGMSLSLIVVAKTRARYQLIHRWLASTQ
mmetsp:Transcript_19536/g.49144  ORF Transcript_19536/g.49144 Transcript_19536/m.49144 type:complete len:265 (-) Transcript_19536:634-1428(-)